MDSDSSLSDYSYNDNTDILNYKKIYTSNAKKCLKLGNDVDKLNAEIEMLNSQIKSSAEESLIQCQTFEHEKQGFQHRIKSLEEANTILEQKYKALMECFEKTNNEFFKLSQKVKSFEK